MIKKIVVFGAGYVGSSLSILLAEHFKSSCDLILANRMDDALVSVADELYVKLCNYFKSKSVNKFVIIMGKALDAYKFYVKPGANVVGQLQVHAGTDSNVFIQRIS